MVVWRLDRLGRSKKMIYGYLRLYLRICSSQITSKSRQSFSSRGEQEFAGYADVMELLFSSWEHIPFNENHIKQIHRDLLVYSGKDERHRGLYKTHENRMAAFDENGNEIATIFQTAY